MQMVIVMEIDEKQADLGNVNSATVRIKRSNDGRSRTHEAKGMNALEIAALLGALNTLIDDNGTEVGVSFGAVEPGNDLNAPQAS